MEEKLSFKYDREADILYINRCTPYAEQESEEIGEDVIARLNPDTRAVENLEILFFSTRLLRNDLFELPVTGDLRLTASE
ncbi:MAG: DUF2283 domain-containing protein [Pseudomonadota bacterium]|nr:DUF2283 domain-containing protein [Pseudomonadota bacterium]